MDSDISGITQISHIKNITHNSRGIFYAKRFIGTKIKQE